MTAEVLIVDSGGANVASLCFAFERLGAMTQLSADPAEIAAAERVVLPGVGAARHAMERLRAAGLVEVLRSLTQPVLGICLGMQLLFQRSAEGTTDGLALVPGVIQGIEPGPGRPVPHMGWNQLRRLKADPLLEGIEDHEYAYFVHSYAAEVSPCTLAMTEYGASLSAIVRRENFCGAQFHPERSGRTGAKLLENFLRL
jgi:glutamine amidotransferase